MRMQINPSPSSGAERSSARVVAFRMLPMVVFALGVQARITASKTGIPTKSSAVCSSRWNTNRRYMKPPAAMAKTQDTGVQRKLEFGGSGITALLMINIIEHVQHSGEFMSGQENNEHVQNSYAE